MLQCAIEAISYLLHQSVLPQPHLIDALAEILHSARQTLASINSERQPLQHLPQDEIDLLPLGLTKSLRWVDEEVLHNGASRQRIMTTSFSVCVEWWAPLLELQLCCRVSYLL